VNLNLFQSFECPVLIKIKRDPVGSFKNHSEQVDCFVINLPSNQF